MSSTLNLPRLYRLAIACFSISIVCSPFSPLLQSAQAAAISPADPAKVLHVAFEAADDGFDMVRGNNNLYSTWVGGAIYDSMLNYDYLARPAKLVPNTVEAMPEISSDGMTYTFHLKKGIFFTPDPAFNGKPRELTAQDYAYSIERVLDPKNRSPQASTFENKIVGLDDRVALAKKTGKFDYDTPIAGFEIPDRYTLRIHLTRIDQEFLYFIAHPAAGAVAREVIEKYGDDTGRHPVGTGPYMLSSYVPRSKITLVANPDYRGFIWNFKSSGGAEEAWDKRVIKEMQGKKMPQIGRVEINIIEEEQPRWLAFESGQLDIGTVTGSSVKNVLDDQNKLLPKYADKGIQLHRYLAPEIVHTVFNMQDPVIGGYTNEKIALRRAIAMAYNLNEEINLIRYGQAVKAQSEITPGIAGFDPSYRTSTVYDPDLANKLLDYFKYKRGADGYRTLPDGKPLVVKISSSPSSTDQATMEIWKRSLDKIGIRTDFPVNNFADSLKAATDCKLMMWSLGGAAGVPDAFDFMESFYGPNVQQGNLSCYKSAAFDSTYDKARLMPDGPERTVLLNQLNRQLEADTPVFTELWRYRNWVFQPWVLGFKAHPITFSNWQYLDIAKH
ncbi:ABC transporter substrate-binding protein [Glaciimonas soli]|uniref:Heme-binding protein n=1 Tax=Glaciimonas soli TaxID=2590999 RepID=A0A843YKJ7_9BURK|nr:ABC transporter substrate-binding protein [Glaciimonas soli]MQQ99914.1 heme-binding protein [Glaciimonas soli]